MLPANEGFGPQCAFTCCVKIATQLLSTTPGPVTKAGDSLDNAAAFQGILTVATAKGASSNDVPQIKSKLQAQDARSQTSDSRKKFVTSDSTATAIAVRDIPTSKQLPVNQLHISSSLTPHQAAPTQSSSQTVNDSNACAQLADGIGLFKSSTSSILPAVQLPASISTTSRIDQNGIGGTSQPTASSKDISALPANDGTERVISDATSPHTEVQTTQAADNQSHQSQGQIPSTKVSSAPVIDGSLQSTASSKDVLALRANDGTDRVISNATALHSELQATPLTAVPSHESQVQIPSTTVSATPVIGGTLQPTPSPTNFPTLSAIDGADRVISNATSPHPELQATQSTAVPSDQSQRLIQSTEVRIAPTLSPHPEVQAAQLTAVPSNQSQRQVPSRTVLGSSAVDGTSQSTTLPKNLSELSANEATERIVSDATSPNPEIQTTQLTADSSQQSQGQVPSITASAGSVTSKWLPTATAAISLPLVAVAQNAPATSVAVPAGVSSTPAGSAKISSALPIAVLPVGSKNTVSAPLVPAKFIGSAVTAASEPVVSTIPASQPVAPKAVATDQTAVVSKAVDTSKANAAVTVGDSTTLATQQAAVAVVQSVATPVSLPSFSFVGESQTLPTAAASQTRSAGRAVETTTDASSRQISSATKSKPGSWSSSPGNRFAESGSADTQTESASTSAITALPKLAETLVMPNQGASVSASSDITNLQQVPQPTPADSAAHSPQSSQSVGASTESTVQTAPPQAVPDSLPMQGVSSAQLIQSMRSSEMKLGMQSAEFGNISISTSLNHQAISAQISIDHSELGRALAVHLPAIEEKLGSAYGVQARVELRESNNPSSSNDSAYSNSGQQSREQRQSQGGGNAAAQGATFERTAARTSFTPVLPTVAASRLDIRI